MGVSGLFNFLRKDNRNFRHFKLHNSYIVIDGNNILYHLYARAYIEEKFNGEYLAFEIFLEDFIQKLRKCSVEPIFVFDGYHEIFKLQVCVKRVIMHMNRCLGFQRSTIEQDNGAFVVTKNILKPFLMYSLLISTLDRLNVSHVTSTKEADRVIVTLAIQLQCPVLSSDNDFFIMRPYWGTVKGFAFLPLNLFRFTPVHIPQCRCRRTTGLCYGLRCEKFNFEGGIFKQTAPIQLPLFAALLGNDYGAEEFFHKHVPCWQQMVNEQCLEGLELRQLRMNVLIQWLSKFGQDIDTPIKNILATFNKERLELAKITLYESLRCYTLNISNDKYIRYLKLPCQLNLYEQSVDKLLEALKGITKNAEWDYERDELQTFNYPAGLVDALRASKFPSSFLDGFLSGNLLGPAGLEDLMNRESARLCTRTIRKLIYGLLPEPNGTNELKKYIASPSSSKVIEFFRNKDCRIVQTIIPVTKLTPSVNFLNEHLDLPRLGKDTKKAYAIKTLLFTWMRFNGTFDPLTFSTFPIALAFSVCAFASVRLHESVTSENILGNFKALENIINKRLPLHPLRFDVLHAFGQLQDVYYSLRALTVLLNALRPNIRCDLEMPPISEVFASGRLIHLIAQEIEREPETHRLVTTAEFWLQCLIGNLLQSTEVDKLISEFKCLVTQTVQWLQDAPTVNEEKIVELLVSPSDLNAHVQQVTQNWSL